MNPSSYGKPVKGFTIIEFLVASVLAIIVIMAAGSTYFMTRKLGDTGQKRLNIQQNLRNATLQISRDARMAGSFGCYNTSSTIAGKEAPDFSNITPVELQLSNAGDNAYGIRKGVTIGGKPYPNALVFVYGLTDTGVIDAVGLSDADTNQLTQITLANNINQEIDPLRQTLAQHGNIVVSSCRHAYGLKFSGSPTGNNIPVNLATTKFRTSDSGELAVTQLYAAAYIVQNKNLLRTDMQPNGSWGAPQIVATGINSMDFGFGYTDNCPIDSLSTASGAATETFTFRKEMATTADKKQLPAVVQVRLNYDANTDGTAGTSDYIINAAVRGGNTCGTRTPNQ